MKNIIDICKDFGIEIPADKHAEFNKVVAENYKTVAEHEKKVNRLTDDLAAEKAARETAENTLKGFEGKDFDTITRERNEWEQRYNDALASHQKEKEDREFDELLSGMISEAKGKNAKAITALLDIEKLRSSRNQEKDIKAELEALRADSGYLFEDNGGAARFTQPSGNGANVGNAKKYTVSELAAMSRDERRAAIAQNLKFKEN